MASTRLASMGRMGGLTASFMRETYGIGVDAIDAR
jgi:hypothetical protein